MISEFGFELVPGPCMTQEAFDSLRAVLVEDWVRYEIKMKISGVQNK